MKTNNYEKSNNNNCSNMSDAIKKELEAIEDLKKESCITKNSIIREFVRKYPNDNELGKRIRALFINLKNKKGGINGNIN